MSLLAVWRNEEDVERPSIWLATDSRISDGAGPLLDEGGKLFSVPLICSAPDSRGFFVVPFHVQALGVGCVGNSLLYFNIYGTLVPILSSLIGVGSDVPSLENVANAAGKITTTYVGSLGERSPFAHRVGVVLVGYCSPHARQEAYVLEPLFDTEGRFARFKPTVLDLDGGRVHFFGDRVNEADAALADERADRTAIRWHRAPTRVLRRFIADPDPNFASIGGDVQLGFVAGDNFVRTTTVSPRVPGKPEAVMRLNNIDLDTVGPIGPCAIGINGMVGL